MLKSYSEIPYPRDYRLNLYQIDDEKIQNNDPVYHSLTVGLNGVTNTTKEKITQSFSLPHNEKKGSMGWLKRLFIGTAVLMGAGTLIAGGYYYMTGRQGRAILPYPADPRATTGSSPIINDRQITAGSIRAPEESHSPYSYYENNQRINSKPIITYNKNILDSTFKKELARFCLSNVHEFVIKSHNAEPNYKYELLSKVVDKIFYYKNIDSSLRQIYFGREQLSVEEKNNEMLMRRKLTTLYLAAETIISGKDTLHFYINAMKDNKNYTSEDLSKREGYIMDYLSAYQSVGEY